VAQFLYVGAQVAAWSYQIPYVLAYTRTAERSAGYLLTGTLLALLRRFTSTWLLRYIRLSAPGIFALIDTAACVGQCCIGCSRGLPYRKQLLYVDDVPTIFALGVKGLGRAQDRRRVHRHGDVGERNYSVMGKISDMPASARLSSACGLFCRHCALSVWIAAGSRRARGSGKLIEQ